MSVMIQIRNVPDDVHRKLKVRAAQVGLSLSDYLLKGAARMADELTMDEMLDRLSKRTPVESLPESAADIIREQRGPI